MLDPRDRESWDRATRPEEAADAFRHAFGALAGEEALFRAFLAECELETERARFWLDVYGRLKPDRH